MCLVSGRQEEKLGISWDLMDMSTHSRSKTKSKAAVRFGRFGNISNNYGNKSEEGGHSGHPQADIGGAKVA